MLKWYISEDRTEAIAKSVNYDDQGLEYHITADIDGAHISATNDDGGFDIMRGIMTLHDAKVVCEYYELYGCAPASLEEIDTEDMIG